MKEKDQFKSTEKSNEYIEKIVRIDRVTKVVKGGKRLAFRAFVIVGDQKGNVGFSSGKAKEVPSAIKKAIEKAKKKVTKVNIVNGTLPHAIFSKYGASRIILMPAKPGTGVIAGTVARSLLELVGIKNVVSKCQGSRNPINVVKAVFNGLNKCMDLEAQEKLRNKSISVSFL